jgi:hypothetical protein
MKFILIVNFLCCFLITAAFADDNPLLGEWRMDAQRSLKELEGIEVVDSDQSRMAGKALRVMKSLKEEGCGTIKVVYHKDTYETIITSNISSSAVEPYSVVERGDNYIVIDQFENGGIGKIIFIKDGFYVNQEIEGFTYKDYFTKAPCDETPTSASAASNQGNSPK